MGVADDSLYYHSVHVVNFDVDEGHCLEWSSLPLGASEANALSMAAMPDSQPTSGGLGDISFAFRFLRDGTGSAPPLWGFSFFRAKRVAQQRRGVFQKALVVLTPLPLFELFRSVVALLAEAYFGSGGDALQGALRQLNEWPRPLTLGATPLPTLLGRKLTVRCVACEPGPTYALALPSSAAAAGAAAGAAAAAAGAAAETAAAETAAAETAAAETAAAAGAAPQGSSAAGASAAGGASAAAAASSGGACEVAAAAADAAAGDAASMPRELGALREARTARALCSLGASCWTLWQLMLTGESLVVLTPSPHQCSAIVLALPALIAPLACMADLRPYLTVHAADWDAQLSGLGPPPGSGVLAGATNPMLARAPPAWLSLLTLSEPGADGVSPAAQRGASDGAGGLLGTLLGPPLGLLGVRSRNSSCTNLSGSTSFGRSGGAAEGDWGGSGGAMAITWTSSVEVGVRADERVLQQLSDASSSSSSSSSGGGGGGGGGVRLARGKSVLNEAPPSEGVDISDEASGGDGDSAERLLREHFEQLTASFLQPLEMFTSMGSLSLRAPPPAAAEPIGGSPGSRAPPGQAPGLMMMHEWSYETQMRFLKELERMEPPPLPRTIVPQRADLLRLYTAFLRTPHFAHWWERRRQRADAAL